MLRFSTFAALLLALVLPPNAARAATPDQPVSVTIDQRPLDRAGGIAVVRNGAVFVDVIDINKAFSGLLLFGKNSVAVNIGGTSAHFTVGRTSATVRGATVRLPAAPFVRRGDIYVPLKTIADLAGAVVKLDGSARVANVTSAANVVRANPLATPTLSAITALTAKASAEAAADGLHVSLVVTNVSAAPYTISFASGARAAFVVSKDGATVWDSTSGMRYTEAKGNLTLAPGAAATYSALWPGYGASGPGRYLLRATLAAVKPVAAEPLSVGASASASASP